MASIRRQNCLGIVCSVYIALYSDGYMVNGRAEERNSNNNNNTNASIQYFLLSVRIHAPCECIGVCMLYEQYMLCASVLESIRANPLEAFTYTCAHTHTRTHGTKSNMESMHVCVVNDRHTHTHTLCVDNANCLLKHTTTHRPKFSPVTTVALSVSFRFFSEHIKQNPHTNNKRKNTRQKAENLLINPTNSQT